MKDQFEEQARKIAATPGPPPQTPGETPAPATPGPDLDTAPLSVAPLSVAPMSVTPASQAPFDPLSVPPLSVGPPPSLEEDGPGDQGQAPNMTPFSIDSSLPHLPPEQASSF